MSELSNLQPPAGSVHRRKRVGRGESSGWGKTSGVGGKGQKGRQGGGKPKRGFEGGQMKLAMRLPKRGFKPLSRVEYALINVGRLAEEFGPGAVVDLEVLRSRGMVKKGRDQLKVLAEGEISTNITVRAHKFSRAAVEKITAAGGSVELIES
ncbi:MAG: 50S ribosomal protein L15 [bacterium]